MTWRQILKNLKDLENTERSNVVNEQLDKDAFIVVDEDDGWHWHKIESILKQGVFSGPAEGGDIIFVAETK